jgi:hypothetical protein
MITQNKFIQKDPGMTTPFLQMPADSGKNFQKNKCLLLKKLSLV